MGEDVYFAYTGLLYFHSNVENRAEEIMSYICEVKCTVSFDAASYQPMIDLYAAHRCTPPVKERWAFKALRRLVAKWI